MVNNDTGGFYTSNFCTFQSLRPIFRKVNIFYDFNHRSLNVSHPFLLKIALVLKRSHELYCQ